MTLFQQLHDLEDAIQILGDLHVNEKSLASNKLYDARIYLIRQLNELTKAPPGQDAGWLGAKMSTLKRYVLLDKDGKPEPWVVRGLVHPSGWLDWKSADGTNGLTRPGRFRELAKGERIGEGQNEKQSE